MNVLLSIACLMRGGTEIQTLHLAKSLIKAKYDVKVLCYFEYDNDIVYEFKKNGCNVLLLKMSRSFSSFEIVKCLYKYYSKEKPDIIHIQYMTPGALAIIAARIAGIKCVIATVHYPYISEYGKNAKILLRISAILCNYFTTVSCICEISWFGKSNKIKKNKKYPHHFTIYNSVDIKKVNSLINVQNKSNFLKKYGDNSSFIFGYIGRLSYEKGIDILLSAFGEVSLKYNDIKLIVVGDGPYLKSLQKNYNNKSWWEKIYFTGTLSWENAVKYLNIFDVAVIPSRFEGFGLSAIEAMAASVPVIASNTGGLTEIIIDKKSGILFEVGNVEDLVISMKSIIENNYVRNHISKNAKERAFDFDVDIYEKKIKDFYNTIS
jgi:L-malate glycosyltransferase